MKTYKFTEYVPDAAYKPRVEGADFDPYEHLPTCEYSGMRRHIGQLEVSRMAERRALEQFLGEPVVKRPWDAQCRHYTVTVSGVPVEKRPKTQNYVYVRESDLTPADSGAVKQVCAFIAATLSYTPYSFSKMFGREKAPKLSTKAWKARLKGIRNPESCTFRAVAYWRFGVDLDLYSDVNYDDMCDAVWDMIQGDLRKAEMEAQCLDLTAKLEGGVWKTDSTLERMMDTLIEDHGVAEDTVLECWQMGIDRQEALMRQRFMHAG